LADSFLLFLFFCVFFSEDISFFLALLFLVHPINVESVAYIGSTQSELYFLPGITALLLSQKKALSRLRLLWIIGLLLFSIFTKETGFLFVILILLYRALFKLGELKKFAFLTGLIAVFYILLRILYGGVTFADPTSIPIVALPLTYRLLNIPSIILFYIKTFFFPSTLLIWQLWVIKTASWTNFLLPLVVCILFFGLLAYIGYLLYKKENSLYKKLPFITYVFFFTWFTIGIGMLLQIIPLDMTVADRWFYFPIVGLLGMIGITLTAFLPSIKINRSTYIFAAAFLLCILGTRTFIRTFDYKDNITLYRHDIKGANESVIGLTAYGVELFNAGKIEEGCTLIQHAVDLSQTADDMTELGNCNQANKQYDDAISAYTRALEIYNSESVHRGPGLVIYLNIAHTLIAADRPQEAIDFINNKALKRYPENQQLLQLLNDADSEMNFNKNTFQNTLPNTHIL